MTNNDNIFKKKNNVHGSLPIQRKNDKSLGNNNDARFYQCQWDLNA
jgi:hypothetical protein